MKVHLLNLFANQLTKDILEQIVGILSDGHDKLIVRESMLSIASGFIPTLVNNASTVEGASTLSSMLNDVGKLEDLPHILSEAQKSDLFINNGKYFTHTLFGIEIKDHVNRLVKKYKLSSKSATTLVYISASILEMLLAALKQSHLDVDKLAKVLTKEDRRAQRAHNQNSGPFFGIFDIIFGLEKVF